MRTKSPFAFAGSSIRCGPTSINFGIGNFGVSFIMSEKIQTVFGDALDVPEMEDDSNNTFMCHNAPNMSVLDALGDNYIQATMAGPDFAILRFRAVVFGANSCATLTCGQELEAFGAASRHCGISIGDLTWTRLDRTSIHKHHAADCPASLTGGDADT
jgi:hypothetical protein